MSAKKQKKSQKNRSVVVRPPKNRRKIRLIVAGVVALLVALGCGIAAALMFLNPEKADAVNSALYKIANGDASPMVVANGTVTVMSNGGDFPINDMTLSIEAGVDTITGVNSLSANMTASSPEEGERISFTLDQIRTLNGDFYLKTEKAAESSDVPDFMETIFMSNEELASGGTILDKTLSGTSGEWVKIDKETAAALGNAVRESWQGESLECLANFTEKLDFKSIADIYGRNRFIVATSEDLTMASRKDPIYKLSLDNERLIGFLDSVQDLNATRDLVKCMGYGGGRFDSKKLVEQIENDSTLLPEVYVEVDNNLDFTRLYVNYNIHPELSITIDFSFSYPTKMEVTEPNEYQDLSPVILESLGGQNEQEDPEC